MTLKWNMWTYKCTLKSFVSRPLQELLCTFSFFLSETGVLVCLCVRVERDLPAQTKTVNEFWVAFSLISKISMVDQDRGCYESWCNASLRSHCCHPPPEPTPGHPFSWEPASGSSEVKDLLLPGRGNASKRTQNWCLGESSDKQSLSREVQKVFFFESNEVCTSSIPLFHSSDPQEL